MPGFETHGNVNGYAVSLWKRVQAPGLSIVPRPVQDTGAAKATGAKATITSTAQHAKNFGIIKNLHCQLCDNILKLASTIFEKDADQYRVP
jgi:hypothetical protein